MYSSVWNCCCIKDHTQSAGYGIDEKESNLYTQKVKIIVNKNIVVLISRKESKLQLK